MTDKEIKNKAKETSGGNYYYEQGFIYGFELGEENGRKEATEENFKEAYQRYVNNSLATFDMKKALEDTRDQIRIVKENEQLKEKLEIIKELVTDYDMCRYDKDNFINKVMDIIIRE